MMESTGRDYAVTKSDEQWREELSPDEFSVLRAAGTERPFTGEYTDTTTEGVYACRACGSELFTSETKFERRLAELLHPARRGPGRVRAGRLPARPPARRGPLRQLRQPHGSRLRGRGLRDPDRPALLHQLDLDDPAPRPGLRGWYLTRPTIPGSPDNPRLRKSLEPLRSRGLSCSVVTQRSREPP